MRIDAVKRRALGKLGVVQGRLRDGLVEGIWPWGKAAPSDFKSWVRRMPGRRDPGFPERWRTRKDVPFATPSRIAVVAHVYFPELVPALLDRLWQIPVDFDLLVTNSSGQPLDAQLLRGLGARNVAVLEVENRGRDLFPLVQLVNAGYLDPYEVVLKVHTKKSVWRAEHQSLGGDGEEWRDALLDGVLPGQEGVREILGCLASQPQIGCIAADGNVLGEAYWGSDERGAEELARRLELDFAPGSLEFAAGSIYWIRAFLLQGLRALNLTAADFEDEEGQPDGTTAHSLERLLGILTAEAGYRTIEATEARRLARDLRESRQAYERFSPAADRVPAARLVPFYLPQFHPSKENDRWWGVGFTEWTNVTAAAPAYLGHNQPLLPGELGFYDLRLDEVRERQFELASEAGIEGFMYYYYWFAGERLLSVPIEKLRAQESLSQPYCIMWANENWTRAWDGRSSDVLISQDYEEVPPESFIEDVLEFLLDRRYMRVNGKAIIAVYRPAQMKDFASVAAAWRQRAEDAGVGALYLLAVDVATDFDGVGDGFAALGLDGTLGFPPHNLPWSPAPAHKAKLDSRFRGNLVSYARTAEAAEISAAKAAEDRYPGVMVGFDNTARRQWRPDIWWGSNPYTFRRWLRKAIVSVAPRVPDERLVFINAWNEWAESAVLEPTARYGATYLLAVRDAAFV